VTAGAVREGGASLIVALRWRSEWPFAAALSLLWLLLLGGAWSRTDVASLPGVGNAGGARLIGANPFVCSIALMPGAPLDLGGPFAWAVMVAAMMTPVALPWVRHVGRNSVRGRRIRAMAIYLSTFLGVWIVAGAAAVVGWTVAASQFGVPSRPAVSIALLGAAAWEIGGAKRRALLRCGVTVPLPPAGWRADRGCIRFGLFEARRCVTTCWALMALMIVIGQMTIAPMAVVATIIFVEQWTTFGWRLLKPNAAILVVLAAVSAPWA
jgi:predicted metal-binding membrane protein